MLRSRWRAVLGGIGVIAAIVGVRPATVAADSAPPLIALPVLQAGVANVPNVGAPTVGAPLTYGDGPVQSSAAVYIVYWGWNGNDPSGQAAYQEAFFNGIGGSDWNASQTQYCQGASNVVDLGVHSSELPRGVYAGSSCPSGATFVGNPTGVLHGTWTDNTNAVPTHPTQVDIEAEAIRAAAFFGNTTAASNQSAQYIIDTPTGNSSSGFGTSWCAYHAADATAYGDIAYTNFPYLTDAGSSCGENAVNAGSAGLLDGVSIAGGHEFAETETDPLPLSGWADQQGMENGDKCAWIRSGQGRMHNITLSTGTFAIQTLWSNAANLGAGGCVG